MKKKIIHSLLIVFIFTLISCKNDKNENIINEDCLPVKRLTGERKNLNVSIFLDLSDRISPTFNPNTSMEYWKRDIEYIETIAKTFELHLRNKKTVLINDNIKLYFYPLPEKIENINTIVNDLDKGFTRENATLDYICSISADYSQYTKLIYSSTLEQNEPSALKGVDDYPGSDIFDFFKSNVKDYCIKENHRNILFILTDGYMFMNKTQQINKNKKSNYVLSSHLAKWGFNSGNYKSKLMNEGFGFQSPVTDLDNLELFVIGLNPQNNWELDVLIHYWEDWFYSMGVKNFKDGDGKKYLRQADLPANIKSLIEDFILN